MTMTANIRISAETKEVLLLLPLLPRNGLRLGLGRYDDLKCRTVFFLASSAQIQKEIIGKRVERLTGEEGLRWVFNDLGLNQNREWMNTYYGTRRLILWRTSATTVHLRLHTATCLRRARHLMTRPTSNYSTSTVSTSPVNVPKQFVNIKNDNTVPTPTRTLHLYFFV